MQSNTKLIELNDGTLVEATVSAEEAQPISGGVVARVEEGLEAIRPVLDRICRSVSQVWDELSQDVRIDQAEIELQLGFTGEGNLFISKVGSSANLRLKVVIKAPSAVLEEPQEVE